MLSTGSEQQGHNIRGRTVFLTLTKILDLLVVFHQICKKNASTDKINSVFSVVSAVFKNSNGIITISIFEEDNVFSMTAIRSSGEYRHWQLSHFFRTFLCKCCDVSCAIFVRRREANACLIMLSTKQGSHWYHF